jgi:hypothetical protein
MAHGRSPEGRASAARQKSVFLNLPYDARFRSLFLAYVAGTSAFGLIPRATLEIPGSARRLDRILALMESCQYSIHDMSRVQLDRRPPPTPRFNMPFELGLAVGYHTRRANREHTWFVFETKPWRLQKSLSDLNGTDVEPDRRRPALPSTSLRKLIPRTSGTSVLNSQNQVRLHFCFRRVGYSFRRQDIRQVKACHANPVVGHPIVNVEAVR